MIEFDKVKEVSISGKQVSEIWQGDNLLWKKDPWVLIGELDWNDYNTSTGNWYDRVNGANWYAPYKQYLTKTDNGIKYTTYRGYSKLNSNTYKSKYNFGYNLRVILDVTTAPTAPQRSAAFCYVDFSSLTIATKNIGFCLGQDETKSCCNWKLLGNDSFTRFIAPNGKTNYKYQINTNYIVEWRITKKTSSYSDLEYFINGTRYSFFDKLPTVEYNMATMQSNLNFFGFPQGATGALNNSIDYVCPSGIIVRNIKFYKIP